MNELLKRREEYLRRKMSHLLFEILEYPPKKELLYIGLCYCQLSRVYSLDEIPISEIKKCLARYLIDFENYPWRDYLLELELKIFYGISHKTLTRLPKTKQMLHLSLLPKWALTISVFMILILFKKE